MELLKDRKNMNTIYNYEPTWESIRKHKTPSWFQKAKFGIYAHWGPYSVPAAGPNVTWYPYWMYREPSPQFDYHCKNFGHPSKFGYKDFIPMFQAEHFDAEEWADLYARSGAKFAGPVAEHHDGFPMWNCADTKWCAAKMGPKRDIVGELEKSIRAKGLKYMVAMHHAENWYFYPHWNKSFDTSNPEFSGLYGEPHNIKNPPTKPSHPKHWDQDGNEPQDKPSKAFHDRWLNRLKEVVDNYEPDYIWFDFGIRYLHEKYRKEFLSYYYNKEAEWNKEVVISYKDHGEWHDLPVGSGVLDIELGRKSELTHYQWITDTTVHDGSAWAYMKDSKYKSTTELVQYLIDNVSKNGFMLLNIGPKPNGIIPDEDKSILEGIGKWLEVNGEAIFDTEPWDQFGEGPTEMKAIGPFSDNREKLIHTPEDIRFTTKNNILYATTLGWPSKEFLIKSCKRFFSDEVLSVELLGSKSKLNWKLSNEGLHIERPDDRPSDHASCFKIIRKEGF